MNALHAHHHKNNIKESIMKLLITGASGFIGSFLVEEALRRGMETWAGVRASSSRAWLQDARIRFAELDLGDDRRLEEQLTWLAEHEGEHPEVTVTYFLPDERKEGGEYATLTGRLKRLDPVERVLLLEAGERVPIGDILLLYRE